LITVVWGAALIGQGLCAHLMFELRVFVHCLLRELGSGAAAQ
jgi:hypothetical protein